MLEKLLAAIERIATALEEGNRLRARGVQESDGADLANNAAVAEAVEKQKAADAAKAKAAREAKAAEKKAAEAKAATEEAPVVETRTRSAATEAAPSTRSAEAEQVEADYYDNILRPAVIKLTAKNREAAIACLKAEGVTKATDLDKSRWQPFVKAVNDAYDALVAEEADEFA